MRIFPFHSIEFHSDFKVIVLQYFDFFVLVVMELRSSPGIRQMTGISKNIHQNVIVNIQAKKFETRHFLSTQTTSKTYSTRARPSTSRSNKKTGGTTNTKTSYPRSKKKTDGAKKARTSNPRSIKSKTTTYRKKRARTSNPHSKKIKKKNGAQRLLSARDKHARKATNSRDMKKEDRLDITVQVLENNGLTEYRNNEGEKRSFVKLCVGSLSGEKSRRLILKDYLHPFTDIDVGYPYKFSNVIQKQQEEYWIVTGSSVSKLHASERDGYPNGKRRSITEALKTCHLSTVGGKIIKKSRFKMRKQGKLPVKSLTIRGRNNVEAELICYDKHAEKDYCTGDMIEAQGVYSVLKGGELWTLPFSKITTV